MLAEGGLRLHPDTARQLSDAQTARMRSTRNALWLATGALALLALKLAAGLL